MSRCRSLALLSAVAALSGCYSYRAARLAGIEPKHEVRVTPRGGRRLELVDAVVAADTLRGRAARQRWFWSRRESVAIAVADISSVEVKRLHVARSVAATVGAFAVVAVPVLVVALIRPGGFALDLGSGDWTGFP